MENKVESRSSLTLSPTCRLTLLTIHNILSTMNPQSPTSAGRRLAAAVLILGASLLSSSQTVFAAHPDIKLYDSWNALMYAAWKGKKDAVIDLIKKSDNIEAHDADHRTALIYAAWSGNYRVIDYLLQAGADINHIDHDGMTALIWAALPPAPIPSAFFTSEINPITFSLLLVRV